MIRRGLFWFVALAGVAVGALVAFGAFLSWAARVVVQVVIAAAVLAVVGVYAWHGWPMLYPLLRWAFGPQ